MNEFVNQIKNSTELSVIYDMIQRDSSGLASDNHITPMEVGE